MLAVGRALLRDPRLLILDEPTEGLAPTIVETLVETMQRLSREGVGILLVEQNLGVATEVCDHVLTMVNGVIAHEMTAEELLADPDAQRRVIGVEASAQNGHERSG